MITRRWEWKKIVFYIWKEVETHFPPACFLLCLKTHFVLCLKTHFPAGWSWSGDPCLNTNRKEVKCRSEIPLPPGVFCKFCGYIWWCGCVWSPRKCGKVEKKKIKFSYFFFTMKPSRLKIMEKVFIFFVVRLVVIRFGCQESVGKLKMLFSFLYRPAPTQYSSPIIGRRKFR